MTRRQKLWSVGCALLVVVTVAPSTYGQILNPRVTLSAGGSFVKASRTFTAPTSSGPDTPFASRFVDGGTYKARLTLDLTKHFSVEGVYGFGPNNLRITEFQNTPIQRDFEVRQQQFQFNFLHFFTSGRERTLRPFLTSGIGAVRFIPTDEAKAMALARFINSGAQIDTTNKLNFNFGGGLEARFSRWLGVRFDVRDQISTVPRFGLPQTPSGSAASYFPINGLVHNIDAGVGIVLYFLR